MPFRSKGYDPETIAFLRQCLDIATEAACRVTGSLPSEDLRQRLASAISGRREFRRANRDELIDFASDHCPSFQRPAGELSSPRIHMFHGVQRVALPSHVAAQMVSGRPISGRWSGAPASSDDPVSGGF